MTALKKPAAKPAADKKKLLGYLQNKEGRVFEATPLLLKQMKNGKFGLMRIKKETYDTAVKNGYMTDPIEDFEDED